MLDRIVFGVGLLGLIVVPGSCEKTGARGGLGESDSVKAEASSALGAAAGASAGEGSCNTPCEQVCGEPSAKLEPAPANAVAAKSGAVSKIARIVFIDQRECCQCTRDRIENSWKTLQAGLVGRTIAVERLHMDTQVAEAKRYREKRAILTTPAVFFLDERGEVVEMFQGELKEEQVRKVLP